MRCWYEVEPPVTVMSAFDKGTRNNKQAWSFAWQGSLDLLSWSFAWQGSLDLLSLVCLQSDEPTCGSYDCLKCFNYLVSN